jgi:hypothetical protein
MKERGLNKRWASQVGIDFANNPEVLKHAQKVLAGTQKRPGRGTSKPAI